MKRSTPLNDSFITLLGVFLLIEGVWGLFSNVVFGILTTNLIHAGVHIFLAVMGLLLAAKHRTKGFTGFIGVLLSFVGILYFIPATSFIVIKLFNVNEAVAVLNIIVAVISFMILLSYSKIHVRAAV